MTKPTPSSQVWSPEQYQQFSSERLRPLLDLIKDIPEVKSATPSPLIITDLGAGMGAAVVPLLSRWPTAQITLVDQSPDMIARLKEMNYGAGVKVLDSDIATWQPDRPQDLIFSNAALHWLDDHETLLPTLMGHLKPGGVLAIGVPNNWQQPSHLILAEIAGDPRWAARLSPLIRPAPLLSRLEYKNILEPLSSALSLFENIYSHQLAGVDPVAEWLKGTSLGPLLAALDDDEARTFYRQYADATNAAYNPDEDPVLTFPFHRLFMIAQKA